jgi:hypothetical protein
MVTLEAATAEHATDEVREEPRADHLGALDVVGTRRVAALKATNKVLQFNLQNEG